MRRWGALLLLLPIWGCSQDSQDEVQERSSLAVQHALDSASASIGRMTQKLRKVNLSSASRVMERTEKKAREVVNSIAKAGDDAEAKIDQFDTNAANIRKAAHIQDIQDKMTGLVAQTQKTGESMDMARARLEKTNPSFQHLEDVLHKAQLEYRGYAKGTLDETFSDPAVNMPD